MIAPIAPFAIGRLPRIVFGAGTRARIADEAKAFGSRALCVTRRWSGGAEPVWRRIEAALVDADLSIDVVHVGDEPSPDLVDEIVAAFKDEGIEVVIAIGGGSPLDAAKAIAGLLMPGNSVMDHLEGVGRGVPYAGPAVPLVAVPTTAGTGSEATKNAVLSRRGPTGFKKSFRDDRLVARVAIVDPDFLEGAPPELIAANGMDAFTQLLESLVSTRANPMTDALAWSGLESFAAGFFAVWSNDPLYGAAGRDRLAHASLMSGITLAQTGLGSVHGLASPMGALLPAPHGVVCGTLVAEATDINIRALRERLPDSPALAKYDRVGRLLGAENAHASEDPLQALVDTLRRWTDRLKLPKLSEYGAGEAHVPTLVAQSGGTSMKTNPLVLTDDEIAELVRRRL